MSSDQEQIIKQHHAMAMGEKGLGHGTYPGKSGDSKVGYAKGGSVGKKSHGSHHSHHGSERLGHRHGHGGGVKHSGHSHLDGTVDGNDHHHSHKSHGHGYGVHHSHTGGGVHTDGSGTLKNSSHSRHGGPSLNQFGPHMPQGGSLKKW